jgi:outer membrane protein OmpA-like peptidoglycan-associated protein
MATFTPEPASAVAPAGAAAINSSPIDIPFARGSATPLTKGLERALEHFRECLSANSQANLLVEGHADMISERSHMALSYSRAKAVRERLLQMGIPNRKITVRAASANETADQPAGAAINRRATLRIEGAPNCAGARGETEPK